MKKARIVAIVLLLVLAISLIVQIRAEEEKTVPFIPGSSGSSSEDSGGAGEIIPDFIMPEELIASWHTEEFCSHRERRVCCYNKNCSYYYRHVYPSQNGAVFQFIDYDICSFISYSTVVYCPFCSEKLDEIDVIDPYYRYHCFVNGICHDCGYECKHVVAPDDGFGASGSPTRWAGGLPNGHPLKDVSNFPFEEGDSYVFNGRCLLCFMPVT